MKSSYFKVILAIIIIFSLTIITNAESNKEKEQEKEKPVILIIVPEETKKSMEEDSKDSFPGMKVIYMDEKYFGIMAGFDELEYNKRYEFLVEQFVYILLKLAPKFEGVKPFADDVKNSPDKNFKELTINNPNYWKAYFELDPEDPTVLLLHTALLMKEKELSLTQYLLMFSFYFCEIPVYNNLIPKIAEDTKSFDTEIEPLIEKGIKIYDKGNHEKALKLYEKALEINPNNVWALYEIGLTKTLGDPKYLAGVPYYEKIIEHDPFFFHAYQCTRELTKKHNLFLEKIKPTLKKIMTFKADTEDFFTFAEGCKEIDQPAFAIYAYWMGMKLNKKFTEKECNEIIDCLNILGHKKLAKEMKKKFKKLQNK